MPRGWLEWFALVLAIDAGVIVLVGIGLGFIPQSSGPTGPTPRRWFAVLGVILAMEASLALIYFGLVLIHRAIEAT